MRSAMRTPYTYRRDFEKELPPFDPERTDYTARELELYSNIMLRDDRDTNPDGPRIVFQEQIEHGWRREITAPTVDATLTNNLSPDGQRMYNRQHPEGRKVNSEQQRKTNRASYYR